VVHELVDPCVGVERWACWTTCSIRFTMQHAVPCSTMHLLRTMIRMEKLAERFGQGLVLLLLRMVLMLVASWLWIFNPCHSGLGTNIFDVFPTTRQDMGSSIYKQACLLSQLCWGPSWR